MSYESFLHTKSQDGTRQGFAPTWMPSCMFDFQQSVTDWNLWKGKSAAFLDCGMGKSLCEEVWAENVVRHTNRPVLILTPLAVAQQMVSEGQKFGIEVSRINSGTPANPGIYVTNYEKLHHFSPGDFAGVVCDESSCIKAFAGVRRAQVTEFLRTIPYRLMATATAAPNDYIELGTTSEALGVMGQMDMLSRFFKNDQNAPVGEQHRSGRHMPASVMEQNRWRLKGHAEIPFWRWVCSWARAGRRPSDLGLFCDDRFKLPPLIEREHIVQTRTLAEGMLFALAATNREEELEERRRTIPERCEMAAELAATGKPFIVWCQLNPEGELLSRLIPDAVHISGADSDEEKEEKYIAFLSGQSRGMISKQKIGGWGLNCQHCPQVIEFSSHSFEAHYQGVRRCWRFGQKNPVINDVITTEGGLGSMQNMQRKAVAADRMFDSLVRHMDEAIRIEGPRGFEKKEVLPLWL